MLMRPVARRPMHPGTSAASEVRELRAQLETATLELERLRALASFTRQARGVTMPHAATRGMARPLVACGGVWIAAPAARCDVRARSAQTHKKQSARLRALPVVGQTERRPAAGLDHSCNVGVRGDAGRRAGAL